MDQFEEIPTVRVTRPEPAGRWRAVAAIGLAILFVLVAKPWGDRGRQASALPSQRPEASPSGRPAGRHYDPDLFGHYEIRPAWEIWPAGYVYKFGIAGPLPLDAPTPALPSPPLASPGAGGSPTPTATPSPTPAATPPPGAGELVDLGSADHLLVVALNTPTTVGVIGVRLWWFDPNGAEVELPLVELPPPWPVTYFHVYGLPSSRAGDDLGVWRPGAYRLDVTIEPGGSVRRIGLLVAPGLEAPDPVEAAPTADPSIARPR